MREKEGGCGCFGASGGFTRRTALRRFGGALGAAVLGRAFWTGQAKALPKPQMVIGGGGGGGGDDGYVPCTEINCYPLFSETRTVCGYVGFVYQCREALYTYWTCEDARTGQYCKTDVTIDYL